MADHRGFQDGHSDGDCKAELALRVIKGRWKLLVLRELAEGTRRFSDLQRALDGISQKVLTDQLRDLEGDGGDKEELDVRHRMTWMARAWRPRALEPSRGDWPDSEPT